MKLIVFVKMVMLIFLVTIISPFIQATIAGIPDAYNNKVAYYVFDSGGPDHFPITSFTDEANIVVIFEGTLWELADSIHYDTGWMRNVNYHYFSEVIRDIKILQSRGVKVLMNVDDRPSWSTTTPFTTWDSVKLDYKQFAEFIKTCAIDSLHLDGISLDIEHRAEGNENYKTLLKEIGKYFGPLSANSDSQMYIAAMFKGYWGEPGFDIGRSKDIMAHLNFLMDMAYFNKNFIGRFNQWADSIGSSKTMIGVLNDYNSLDSACMIAAWQPPSGSKAGIMVYAANNLKSYTDSIFRSLVVPTTDVAENGDGVPQEFKLMQNYPNPFNPSTTIEYQIPASLAEGIHSENPAKRGTLVIIRIYDILGREVTTLVNEEKSPGKYEVEWKAINYASGLYFAQLTLQSSELKSYTKTIKMLMTK